MKNVVIELVEAEFNDIEAKEAIDNICKKKELIAMMVGYILRKEIDNLNE